jgi:hypothetical protein
MGQIMTKDLIHSTTSSSKDMYQEVGTLPMSGQSSTMPSQNPKPNILPKQLSYSIKEKPVIPPLQLPSFRYSCHTIRKIDEGELMVSLI